MAASELLEPLDPRELPPNQARRLVQRLGKHGARPTLETENPGKTRKSAAFVPSKIANYGKKPP